MASNSICDTEVIVGWPHIGTSEFVHEIMLICDYLDPHDDGEWNDWQTMRRLLDLNKQIMDAVAEARSITAHALAVKQRIVGEQLHDQEWEAQTWWNQNAPS